MFVRAPLRTSFSRASDEADARLLKEHRRRMDAEEQARAAKLQVRLCKNQSLLCI